MPILIDSLLPVFAIIVVGATISSIVRTVTAMKYRYGQRVSGDSDQLRRIEESVGELRDQVAQLRGDVVDLGERVDFAERVLTQARDEGRLLEGRPRGGRSADGS